MQTHNAPLAGGLQEGGLDFGNPRNSQPPRVEPGTLLFGGPDITETEDCIMVWTDGSGRAPKKNRHGEIIKRYPAGWAFVMEHGGRTVEKCDVLNPGTVNSAELTAIIKVLEYVRLTSHPLIIHTDSKYSQDMLLKWGPDKLRSGDWTNSSGLPTSNKDIIERGLRLLKHHQQRRTVLIRHIRGHRGIVNNERADFLCGQARRSVTPW